MRDDMKQIALYGKGGIGKSTTSANLSAALGETGLDILQIGCDPKHDSTRMLMHGAWIPTVLDLVRERGDAAIATDDVVFNGYAGVRCVEAGGPEPGIGCAGRGIIATFQLLERLGALNGDVIVYDVLGDVVCGGFAMPMREGYAEEVYLITSGELMSLYAANNIAKAIARLAKRSRQTCALAGVICNSKNMEGEEDLVREFAARINSAMVAYIPRSRTVTLAELNRQTVMEYAPESEQAGVYRRLAEDIMKNTRTSIPTPLEIDELEELARRFAQV
ncbi:NifH/frxC-family protein [Methanofollis liminatans DSM 4140]|jgi:nitrogenase iron protein NifH|uniref:NifH/frxC-family protein n=2 Tax=Methanofollis liminatans TaxID=2201 RepID=J1L3X8_9EURY|nr:NifH/frxC-family protein [Methanofollis liminatans DSM 4140]